MSTNDEDNTEQPEQKIETLGGGLDLLSDETLARIVEGDIERHGEIRSRCAAIAFEELARRSGRRVD
ncbi:MAG: hypothetical protein MUC88_07210 [Planctomycetes bacterium]|jgi:hypothetical protein|nr:hypothetical protein [Planctomycetota bacterium]